MKEETKDKIKEAVTDTAEELRDYAREEAKKHTGVWRVIWALLAIAGAGISALLSSGCEHVPKAPHVTLTVEQVQAVETIYEVLGGEVRYRVVPVEPLKK